MTKEEYLKLEGFNPQEWSIMSTETSVDYLKQPGAVNNMFEVKDRKGVAAFGKGTYKVNLKWFEKTKPLVEVVVTDATVPLPPETKSSIPPPPPSIPKVVEEQKPEISSFLKTRIANLVKHGWTDSGSVLIKEGCMSMSYDTLEEMENDDYMPLIMVKQTEPIAETSNDFLCDKEVNTGTACQEQCSFCKKKENPEAKSVNDVYEESHKAIDKAIEDKSKATYSITKEERIKMVEAIGLRQEGAVFISDDKSCGIEVVKVNTANDNDFMESINKITAYIEEQKTNAPKLDPVEKAKKDLEEIVNASGIPKDNVVIASVPKVEITEEMKTPVIADEKAKTITDAVESKDIEIVDVSNKVLEKHGDKKLSEALKDIGNSSPLKQAESTRLEEFKEIEKETRNNIVSDNFFSKLSSFGFQQLNLTINNIGEGKLNIIVKPVNFSGDPAFDKIPSLVLNGTIEELDKGFFEAISEPLVKTEEAMSNAKSFMDELAKQEKETKAKKAIADKVKKAVDEAKKITGDKDFKDDDTKSLDEGLKAWGEVIEIDSEHKVATKTISELQDKKSKLTNTLL